MSHYEFLAVRSLILTVLLPFQNFLPGFYQVQKLQEYKKANQGRSIEKYTFTVYSMSISLRCNRFIDPIGKPTVPPSIWG